MSSLGRRTSGEFATAFETALSSGGDDFLTRDEVTIDQIHSLSTGSPLHSTRQGSPSLHLNTDLVVDTTDRERLVSPVRNAASERVPENMIQEAKESPATKPKAARGVPRVASLVKPAPKKADSLTSKPLNRESSRTSPASSKALSPNGRSAVSSRTNSATMSRIPSSPGAASPLSPPSRSASASSARNAAGSPIGSVSRSGTMSRVPSASARPTSPENTVNGSGRFNGSMSTTARPGSAASRGALSPTGVAPRAGSSSRIPRPGGSAGPSPDGKPGDKSRTIGGHPSSATSPSPTVNGSSAGRTGGFSRGPSGKYAGASSTKAPARKALEDIMSELQDVKHQLGLPVSGSRRSSAATEAPPKEDAPVPSPEVKPAQQTVEAAEASINSASSEAATAPETTPVVEERIVFNISVAEEETQAAADEVVKAGEGQGDGGDVPATHDQQTADVATELEQMKDDVTSAVEDEVAADYKPELNEEAEDTIIDNAATEGEGEKEQQVHSEAVNFSSRETDDHLNDVAVEEAHGHEEAEAKASYKMDALLVEAKEVPADATANATKVASEPDKPLQDAEIKEPTAKCACCVVM